MERRLPSLYYNWISLIGTALAIVSMSIIAFLFAFDLARSHASPYFGIITYIIMPVGVIIGLLLIPIGMLRERRIRDRKTTSLLYSLTIDFTNPRHRNAFIAFLIVTAIFLIGTAVGSYQAYHYTETVDFCGRVCHTIMQPEYTAYQQSPHARVTCAECHVGQGASLYVKSKLSGAYQVYAAVMHIYPRPIPTPIKNLVPARETCEQCHWPEKFYGEQETEIHRYRADETNTDWKIDMLLNVGGRQSMASEHSGIHWHIANQVAFIATDSARQDIPWVQVTYEDGSQETYNSMWNPLPDSTIATSEKRIMTCIDCHNRPTHIFKSPMDIVDEAITSGDISPQLPYIKQQAVYALRKDYTNKDSALTSIEQQIRSYYRQNYPEVTDTLRAEINQAVTTLQTAYSNNFFPYMKVRWDTHKQNIGHFADLGCFRCHNGNMADDAGDTITHDCNACHSIIEEGPAGNTRFASNTEKGLDFKHPVDIGEAWRSMNCSDCHNGGGAVF